MVKRIRQNYKKAFEAWEKLSDNKKHMVQELAEALYAIKKMTGEKAVAFGYARACKESIAICRGECCRHHYPKIIADAELLAIIGGLTPVERERLSQRMLRGLSKDGQCALLTQDGCFLPFRSRPMVCTNAYPCFASKEYWKHKEAGNHKAKPIFQTLEDLILQGEIS